MINDSIEFPWVNIRLNQKRFYIWAHEICHAWVADQLGHSHSIIEIKKTSGTCWIKSNYNICDLEMAWMTAAAPVFFFDQYVSDNYLKEEYAKARSFFDKYIMYKSNIREWQTGCVSRVRKMLPKSELLMKLTQQISSSAMNYDNIENVSISYISSSNRIITKEKYTDN